MSDKIADIRERHLHDERWRNGPSMISPQSHADRATLLAEIERQSEENEKLLQAVGLATTAVPDMQVDIENPIGMMQRVVAEVEKLRTEIERLKQEPELLRAELISLANAARKALADAYDRAKESKP